MRFKLFTTRTCPKCPAVKQFLQEQDIEGDFVDASTPEGLEDAKKHNVMNVPTVIFFDQRGEEIKRANNIEEIRKCI